MKAFLHKNGLLALLIILITACSGGDSGSAATFNLTVATDGPGAGTVTSAPAGIDCGTDCSESYAENTVVSLTASPAAGSSFTSWSGACSGTDSCSVTMDAAKSVTAAFSDSGSAATFNLTVATDGTGAGTVASTPAGIDCGTDCSETYTENTLVSLTASPSATSSFAGWSGACSGTDSCSVTMDAAKSVTATFVEYSVDCSAYAVYTPGTDPLITLSPVVPAKATVIVMHGKAGSPLYLSPLSTGLANAGFDVIAPYLPWSDTVWDGSMCEAMNYIDELTAQEATKGNHVIIAGHSMGGAHALIYGVTSPAAEVKGIITLAPGHFPQLEGPLLALIDPSIAISIDSSIDKAEDMVANGFGDQLDTFVTLIPDLNNPLLQISATANDYLSYHALYQYPDINDVLPTIKLPVLWLAGDVDPLTSIYGMPGLFSRITSQNSIYQVVSGDHLGMVSNSAAAIVDWMPSLGL